MKLTWKLSLALGLGVLIVLTGHAALRVHRDVVRFRQSVRDNHQTVGRVLAATLEEVAARDGADRARTLLEQIARREPLLRIRWVDTEPSTAGGTFDAESIVLPSGTEALRSTTTLHASEGVGGIVEIVEPLDREVEYAHEAILRTTTTTCVVLLLCVTVILAFGVLFVGRPLEALRRHAQRVGRGERGVQTPIGSSDEIGELAREMNTMAEALDQARVRARAEEAARLDALAQLRQADRLRVVGELASSVAHDLGTPMGTVSARAQMIANGEVSPERARELAGAIVDEITNMTATIRQLLDHGRRESPQRVRGDLTTLVAAVVDLVRPVGERRNVVVDVERSASVRPVEMDAAQMRHVLVNLLGNALDASPDGAHIDVRVDEAEGSARVRVRDRGPGVPPDQLTAIFEPFFTTKAPQEGSGLGLSIARGIVDEHGGQLRAYAAEGGGTVFEVTLPTRSEVAEH